jgi:C-lobe and N-lobe beta barrels of Tf-binding protein B
MGTGQAFGRMILLLGLSALDACGGGGGGNLAASIPSGVTPPTTPTNSPGAISQPAGAPTGGAYTNTGWTGSVGTPAPASFGTSPMPAQFATTGGPVLVGNGNTAMGVSFPAFSSSLQITSSGLSAADPAQSASIISYTQPSNGGQFSYRLVVPALNIDTTIQRDWLDFNGVPGPYVYLDAEPVSNGIAYYGYGFETPGTAIPTAGTAAFSGLAEGYVYSSTHGQITGAYVQGNAALSVNFGSGSITGAFTNMKANLSSMDFTNLSSQWNDVSLNASIAAGTSKFSGATAVTSTPQTPLSLSGNATGHIDGGFYGPAAQSIGAIWSLSDGTTSVVGGVAARH